MPIFDNELLDNVSDRSNVPKIDRPLGSALEAFQPIDSSIGLAIPGQYDTSYKGITADEARKYISPNGPMTPNSPFSLVSRSELLANQRYPLYERGVNLENVYGLQQSGLSQLGNGLIKAGGFALGTFGQSFATIPNTISAIKNLDFAELSNPDGYESAIDTWVKNLEDKFPNYVTDYERSRGLATAIPFTYGSANFWGDKIIKNTGFMVGAIGGAIAQDAIIGVATEGIGTIPLVAAQLGKASLWLNKLLTGANKVDKVLDLARAAGKSEQVLLNIERLGQLAATQKLENGFRYGMSIYGSARTEAAIEARDSYNTIKEQLINDYKLENNIDPSGEELQQIEDYATDAMNTRFGINMALLTVSNAVQFDNLFKNFIGAQKGITSSTVRNFQDAGKLGLKEGSLDIFERKLPETFRGKVWDAVKPRAVNILTEGVYEEGGQFAAEKGVSDYYTRKYKNKESWDFVKEAMTSTTKGLAEQFGSSEGLENMIIGGITAALTGEAMTLVDKIKGQGKNKRLETAVNIMNQYGLTGVLSEKYKDTSRSTEIAKQMQEAVASNNIFKYKNLKSDMLFNFVNSRIPIGMHDVTIEQLKMLKDLSKEEFEKTFGMDFSASNKETVNAYVDNLISKADSIKETVDGVNSMFANPYKRVMNPKTDDDKLNVAKYEIFESWKTNLSQLSVVQQDVDNRLLDIQTSVNQIDPSVNNDLLGMLTSTEGLKDLNSLYEQKANTLSESLATVDPSKREAIRSEIKKLRTISEKISMALVDGQIDPTLFNSLLNFEVNGQDFSQSNKISLDKSQKLSKYGEDISALRKRKVNAEEGFDYLASEKGFDSYFETEEDASKNNKEEVAEDLSKPDTKKYEFINKSKDVETPVVDREYQLANTKLAKVRKAGEQYKVTSPTGEVTYYDTREEAKQVAADLNVDFAELTKVKILALNEDGTLKVEDLAGNIQNINPKLLQGYEKLQTEEEKLGKDKETLDTELQKLEIQSADVETVSTEIGRVIGSEDKRKDVDILFLSTTSPSDKPGNESINNLPHIKRARTFLNNFKFFTNRNKIKVILVTPNNAKELGLEGIVQVSYNKNLNDPLTESETNSEMGFMAQVFIIQTPQGDFFVDQNGKKLSKVGEESSDILDKVVFETMTSASLYTEGGFVKARAGQEEEAERALEAYKIFRAEVFAQKGYTPYSFAISRGMARENVVNGQREDNHVQDILGPNANKIISMHGGLITVVTTGKFQHNGELLSFPKGTTLIQFGDLLDFVNNKKVNNKQASNIFAVIDALSKDLINKSNNNQPVKINYSYSKFLQNVLYWRSKADTQSPSQIGIDTTTMEFKIGNKSFPLSKISESKQEVMDALQDAFITVNNKTLEEGVSKKFTEYVVDAEGNLSQVVWANYQTYLLSSKNPDGSSRSTQDTPLITHTAKPTETAPSYKQKYSYITDKDVLPFDKVPVKEAKPAPIVEEDVVGDYKMDGATVNTFDVNTGPILFTGTVSSEGIVNVEIQTNPTIEKLSTEQALVNAVDQNLKSLPENVVTIDLATATNEDKAKFFVKTRIENEIGKELDAKNQTQQVAPEAKEKVVQPMTPPEVVAQQDIEAKKAEIEKLEKQLEITKATIPVNKKGIDSLEKQIAQKNAELAALEPKQQQTSEVDTKADIERRWQEDLSIGIPTDNYQIVQGNSKDMLIKFREYLTDVLGWEKMPIGYSNKNLTLDYLGTTLKIPAELIEMGGGGSTTLGINIKDVINAKYKAELAALEGGKKPVDNSKRKGRGRLTRLVGQDVNDRMTNSDLEVFKQWHAEKVPFIPFEVLENIIKLKGGKEAWGVFENGVAKFVKGGLRGTEYHEIFEAIWADFLTESEKNNILNEFRNKKGEFTDRASGKKYQYSEASDDIIKERIADDFSDFRLGKLPARSLGEKVRNFFKRIMDFFKSFVNKPSLKDELFKAIDSGKFKETKLSERAKALAPQYRAVEGLSEQTTNDYVQDMVGYISYVLFNDGKKELLFNPEQITGEGVLKLLKEDYSERGEIESLGEGRYNELVTRSIDFLRTIGISINEEEVVTINDENSNQKDYAGETFSADWKKNSTGALRFLLSTLQEREPLNQTKIGEKQPLKLTETKLSNIEGIKLLNFNRVFSTLLDRLHNTNDPAEFAKKLIQLAKEDSNYVPLFKALGGNLVNKTFDFSKFGDSDWRLYIQFFNTFSRQKPEALIQYISEEGEVYTNNANVFSLINQNVNSWVTNMKTIGKSDSNIITYDNKVYKINTKAISDLPIKKSKDMLDFLSKIGIEFPVGAYEALSDRESIIKGKLTSEKKIFVGAVKSIYTQLGRNNNLMTFDAKKLEINGPLRALSALLVKVDNPNQDSTYFGVEGQRIGSFAENNAPSYFENNFNEANTLEELLQKMPQLNDVYSRGSEVLKKGGLFFDEDGNRIAEIKVEYIQGSKNESTGKNKSTSKLELGERFVQEINQNLSGKYYVLIPGDSSTEWMMNLGNVISMEDVMSGKHWNKVYTIYNNYLTDDIKLALENRKQNLYTKSKSQELRIMRDILPQNIVEGIENRIKQDATFEEIEKYVSNNKENIDRSIKSFIENMSNNTIKILLDSNQISSNGENGYYLNKFDTQFLKEHGLNDAVSMDELLNFINFVNINYQINNQEYHKILFGDPYQFKSDKGKLDETKRVKSFLSPRRRTFDSVEYNNFLKDKYNTVENIQLDENTPGYHDYKSYTNSITFDNVKIVGSIATLSYIPKEIRDAYSVDKNGKPKIDETDAMSWLMDSTHKEIALKEGQWTNEAEAFHQWQMAYTRRAFDKKGIKKYTSEKLRERDNKLLASPMPKYKLAVRKPIVSGNKANKTEIDLVLDKTSQMPLYYSMVEGKNLENMYVQMFKQQVGYGIVLSGRKVGAEQLHSLYDSNGNFNNTPFENIVEVPWSSYGTQVETMSEGEKEQTRGSQLTKMSTMDLYENGETIGATPERKEVIKKATERNTKILDLLNENAYNELLDKLGVIDLGDGFALEDNQRVSDTLMYEMMRRELSENAKDTIQLDENGEFLMPFEASPSYVQIKSILYSMVNKALISPPMNGAPHVQVPVTMFEKATEGRSLARKTENGWVKINKKQYAALSEEEKTKVVLTDDTLKFYTKEDPYCEILLPAWFKKQLTKGKFKDYTDDQLVNYLNKTTDGKAILKGIAFRIPTQALSSVEVFKVKGFLPEYMGYTVVVPSEITSKAGSDFDIDKLNIYLKSIYIDKTGDIRLVTYKGSEQATKDFYKQVYDETTEAKSLRKAELIEAIDILVYGMDDTKGLLNKYGKFILSIQDENPDPIVFRNTIEKQLEKLTDENLNAQLRETYANKMYKKSLENEYYDSLEELLTLPENFNKLITPVDDAGLEKMSEVLDDARGYNEAGIKGKLIDRNYMTSLRHAFITGKRWVGIAAVNITNLSLRQKSKVYLDPSKLSLLSPGEFKFVKDLNIVLPHNTIDENGEKLVSLSGTKTADGTQLISSRLSGYATAFVDIANNPFITKIVKSDVVVSTFMFLESIGAGNSAIFFLNQPIIAKYLEYLDGISSKSVMSKRNLEYIRDEFPTTDKALQNASISVEGLLDNIKEYANKGKFDQIKNAEQLLILDEFIKYKILADQLFTYTQATNYDTTRFGSSDALLKKEWGTFNVSNFNLISNVNDVLKNTFIGKQADLLSKSFGSFGAILKTELPEIKAYTLSTLKRYATKKYISKDDYEKIANLIKNSFIDYVIQNNTTMSNMIEPTLVNSQTAVVSKLEKAKQKYPSMQILKDLSPVLGNRDGSAKSIELKANVKDAYSENLYIGMMRELRDANPELNDLYNDIVNVAILQGTAQSAISIRNIIPVEDYAAKVAPIIQQLQATISLESFENGMFERNNFNNKDLFQEFNPYFMVSYNEAYDPNTGEEVVSHFFPNFKSIKGATQVSRKLITLNDKFNSFQLSSDFIRVPKIVTNRDGKKVNLATGLEVTKADYAKMKKAGDFNLFNSYYYKKVYTQNLDEFGNALPLMVYNKKTDSNEYYYKMINVYGDGNRAVEYNTNFTPSVIDNGSMRINQELNDKEIVDAIAPQIEEEVVPLPTKEVITEQVGQPGEQLDLFSEEDLGLNTDFNQDDFKC